MTDSLSPQGDVTFTTETGTVYRIAGSTVTREGGDPLRGDDRTLRLFAIPVVEIGKPVIMALEPLDPAADVTFRETTPVVSIEARS